MKNLLIMLILYVKSLSYIIYLITIGFFVKKNRKKIIDFYYSKFEQQTVKPIKAEIQEVDFDDIILPINLNTIALDKADGNVSEYELKIISKLVKIYKPKKIFEFGTFNGRTTLSMAINSTNETIIYTIDLPPKQQTTLKIDEKELKYINKKEIGEYINKNKELRIIQLFGDSAKFDFSPYYNSIDFIFIDASHSYEYVINDSLIAMKLINEKGGIILWHDYDTIYWEGVTRALNEFYLNNKIFKQIKHIANTTLAILFIKNEQNI